MKIQKFLNSLTPVKRRIALYLIFGHSPEITAKKISKENNSSLPNATAWVTMVLKAAKAKKIEFKGLKKFEVSENKQTKVAECKPTYSHDPKKDFKKVSVQERLLEEVKSSGVKGLVLTLSWIKCIVESQINSKIGGLKFLSCEQDRETFASLEREIAEKSLKFMLEPLRCEIGTIINLSAMNTFAHLFLDYCGHLTTYQNEISNAIRNKIVQKNGLIWITVTGRSGKGNKGYNSKKELLELIEKVGGTDYVPKFVYSYKDENKMPMVTVIIKREN